MTLAEMSDFVCHKVRQTDAEAISQCKGFIKRRYELVYAEALWRDAMHVFTFEAGPDAASMPRPNLTDMQAAGIVYFPVMVSRLVALRSDKAAMRPEDEGNLYRMTEDAYESSGEPAAFMLLPPVVAASLVTPIAFYCSVEDSGDVGVEINGTLVLEDGTRCDFKPDLTSKGVFPKEDPYDVTLISLGATIIERITKPVTVGSIYLCNANGKTIYAVGKAEDTKFERHFGCRILPQPQELRTFRALVKKKPMPLVDDDEPELRDVTNALLAFAQGDMLERGRQYGKAATKYQEALTLVDQLKRIAVWQESCSQQITPDVAVQSGEAGAIWNPWA